MSIAPILLPYLCAARLPAEPNPKLARGRDGVQRNVLDGVRLYRAVAGRIWTLPHPRRGRVGSQKTRLWLPLALRAHYRARRGNPRSSQRFYRTDGRRQTNV